MNCMDNLEERVSQFEMMRLPGQPRSMHMGTSYLINDLWHEVQKLRKALDEISTMGPPDTGENATLMRELAREALGGGE